MPLNVQNMSGVSHEMVGTCLECLEHALTCMDMPDISGYQLLRHLVLFLDHEVLLIGNKCNSLIFSFPYLLINGHKRWDFRPTGGVCFNEAYLI